ncbi:DNA polymerase III subunit delta [Glycocaulis abyssi]|uniref:DNA-directed DNA polymerase n=1 Tax=Glycocaulis abyssi TaxID=1433403 RepID=A0ABV9NDU9_9PROT
MVKPSGGSVDRLLKSPPPDLRVFVIFGPDSGLVRERAQALSRSIAGDPDDPFNVTRFTDEDIKADAAALADAMAAMSLMGGERLVRVRLSGDSAPVARWISEFEAGEMPAEGRLVVEAGNLTKASKLRKAAEDGKKSAAIACYEDNARDLIAIAEESFKTAGLALAADARHTLAGILEGDRELARSEIEKLILYKGFDGGEITLEDIAAISTESADAALDKVIDAALCGEIQEADLQYRRALESGTSPVAIVRALQRKIDQIERYHQLGGDQGALARSGAPRFGPPAQRFQAAARAWSRARIARAREIAFETERAIKRSGSPAEALAGETLLRLARAASPARAR